MAEILHWNHIKTRKPHRCFGCGKRYPANSDMIHAAYTDGGQAYGCYWCPTCNKYMLRNFEPGDEVCAGEIYENDPEGWDALRKETEG